MSYGFIVVADSKDEAGQKVSVELSKVVETQAVHGNDAKAAQDVVEAFIEILADPDENEQVRVSVSGSLNWRDGDQAFFTGACVSVQASLQPKA